MIDYSIFQNQNRWRTNPDYFKNMVFLNRSVFDNILKWFDDDEILILTGSRQVGKSTLMYMLIQHLLEQKQVASNNIFYFNLDEFSIRSFFQNTALLIDFINFKTEKTKKYLFIDEFQKMADAGTFLKAIYDLKLPLKIIVSGSSSLEISKSKETLTGRKQIFFIYPFSFQEFIHFKNPELQKIKNFEIKQEGLKQLFIEYITYGGYPRILLENDITKKEMKLREIYNSYIEKDIINLLKIDNVEKFNKLVYLLSNQVGNLVNKNEISNTLALNMQTTERYLNLLSGTYVFDYLPPYFNNPRKEISKMPKVFINDLGLKNMIDTKSLFFRDDGPIIENFVYNDVKKMSGINLNYWRTFSKAEVDFVFHKGDLIIPIEVKYTQKKPRITGGLLSFIKKYRPRKILIITKDFLGTDRYEGAEVEYVPVYALSECTTFQL
jgi:uncharacterized protein